MPISPFGPRLRAGIAGFQPEKPFLRHDSRCCCPDSGTRTVAAHPDPRRHRARCWSGISGAACLGVVMVLSTLLGCHSPEKLSAKGGERASSDFPLCESLRETEVHRGSIVKIRGTYYADSFIEQMSLQSYLRLDDRSWVLIGFDRPRLERDTYHMRIVETVCIVEVAYPESSSPFRFMKEVFSIDEATADWR